MRKITQEIVRELLDYDPATGLFTSKQRSRKWFPSESKWKQWNIKHAGKRTFTSKRNGYLVGTIFGTKVYAHRVAFMWMTGRWPRPMTDHVNRVRADNRWINLREVTYSQNVLNCGPLTMSSKRLEAAIDMRLRNNRDERRSSEPVECIMVRVRKSRLPELDKWIKKQDDVITRPEGVRRLIDIALKANGR